TKVMRNAAPAPALPEWTYDADEAFVGVGLPARRCGIEGGSFNIGCRAHANRPFWLGIPGCVRAPAYAQRRRSVRCAWRCRNRAARLRKCRKECPAARRGTARSDR